MSAKVIDKEIADALADDERIRKEYDRLFKLFTKAPKKRLDAAKKLVSRAAFMGVTLDDLEKHINKEGVTEPYQNGANQHGVKKSSHVEVYNIMVKNYAAVIKQLTEILGCEEGAADDFDKF